MSEPTTDAGAAPTIETVADGFWVRQEVDNVAWIDMGGFAIVIDTLEHVEKEQAVFDAIASTLGDVPIRYVLNTHTHYDHVGLNAAFQRRCGCKIVNQQTAPLGHEGRWFEGTRRRALMLPMGGCHTAEDCIIHLPDDGALFTGDLFGWGLIPLIDHLTTDSARRVVATVERLIAYEAGVVIPGHGPLCTTDTLRRWIAYFHWLIAEVTRACAEGLADDQITARLAPPADMRSWWRFELWKHQDSLTRVVTSVRNGRLGIFD